MVVRAAAASAEAWARMVDIYYGAYLDRDADAAGRAAWATALQSGRLDPAQVAQALLASDEFFSQRL